MQLLARVLDLDDVETEYLLNLGTPNPKRRRRHRRTERVPERLHHLPAAFEVPAFIEGRYSDVLASNDLAVALSPRLTPGHNRLRSLLLDPEERRFRTDWETACGDAVAGFRNFIADGSTDPRAVELMGELTLASARFRQLWERHDVRRLAGGSTTVNHRTDGPLHLHREKLPVEDVVLVL